MSLQDLFEPTQPTATSPPALTLQEFVYGKPAEKESSILKALELLGRPSLALGEAMGAYAYGEPIGEAVRRGLRGERRYGTPGEFLIPEKPEAEAMEALGRGTARLGLDILTDPTWLIGAPAASAAGKLVGPVAAKVLGKLPIERLKRLVPGRYILPMTTHLEWFGGKPGKLISKLYTETDNAGSLRTAVASVDLARAAKNLGIGAERFEPLRRAARAHIESGALASGAVHPDSRVQQYATYVRDALKTIGVEGESFLDPTGQGFKVVEPVLRSLRRDIIVASQKLKVTSSKWRNAVWENVALGTPLPPGAPAGASKLSTLITSELQRVGVSPAAPIWSKAFYSFPFRARANYFPHMPTSDFLRQLGSEEGFTRAVQDMARMNGISELEAMRILRRVGAPRRAGNIEYARVFKMPYEEDPQKALPRYFEQVFGRIESARRFGTEGQVLDQLLKRSVTRRLKGGGVLKGITPADAELARDAILGRKLPASGLERVARQIMGYQVMTKMGPMSALMNLSQSANTVVRDGGVNFLKGTLRSMTDEGARQGAIAYQGGIHEALLRMMGATSRGAQTWLDLSMFTPTERLNRILASNSGIRTAERLIRQSGGRLTRALESRGLTAADLQATVANGWKLPQAIGDKVGMLASNATQHVTRLKDIPLAWQSPEMRLFTQFKQFVYQQTRFLFREVVNPFVKFYASGGKEGAIAPMLRFAATFGIGGQVVAHLRDQAQSLSAGLLGLEHDPRAPIPDDWALRVIEDSLNMGGLGVAGDLVARAARRDFKGWLLGPSVGDLSDMVEMLTGEVGRARREGEIDWSRIGVTALKHIPMLAPLLPRRPELREAVTEATGGLELLFSGR